MATVSTQKVPAHKWLWESLEVAITHSTGFIGIHKNSDLTPLWPPVYIGVMLPECSRHLPLLRKWGGKLGLTHMLLGWCKYLTPLLTSTIGLFHIWHQWANYIISLNNNKLLWALCDTTPHFKSNAIARRNHRVQWRQHQFNTYSTHSTHVISTNIVCSSDCFDVNLIVLEKQCPSHDLVICQLTLVDVDKRLMICLKCEPSPIQIHLELLDCPDKSQTFPLHGWIPLLSGK